MADTQTATQSRKPVEPANIARGELAEERDGSIVLAVPGTDYRVSLLVGTPINAAENDLLNRKVRGVIRAQARRIDVVKTGGRFIEPIYGRPRRVQGVIVATDPAADTVTVQAHESLPIVCKTNGAQHAADFKIGQFVAFDIAAGATFSRVTS